MGSLIGFLATTFIGEKWARPAAYALLALGVAIALFGAKCTYDHAVIAKHEAKQDAANAKADRKADAKAAEQRRVDDTRSAIEATQIKEAVNEAGSNPAARRAAYYECVRVIQSARANGKQPPDC
jgi:hypothetical protein